MAERTGYDGLRRGRGEHASRAQAPRYQAFAAAVELAMADAKAALIARWYKATETDWRAAMALLERRFPDKLGKTVKLAGHNGGKLVIEVVEVDWAGVQTPDE